MDQEFHQTEFTISGSFKIDLKFIPGEIEEAKEEIEFSKPFEEQFGEIRIGGESWNPTGTTANEITLTPSDPCGTLMNTDGRNPTGTTIADDDARALSGYPPQVSVKRLDEEENPTYPASGMKYYPEVLREIVTGGQK